jgi:hypothetical protein
MSCEFNASIFVSEQLNRQLVNLTQDLSYRCIAALAEHYNFDAEEASRYLNLSMIKVERKAPIKGKSAKATKVSAPKAAFPLPYNGEFNDACCYALRQNNGLYTQCTSLRKGDKGLAQFCKGCASQMQKTGAEVPEYGTIQQRNAVGIFEYTDPKGRKPIAYTKVMKKYKITQEQVIEEGAKLNIIINSDHFNAPEETKRGRPSLEKSPKEKGQKGRPRKSKKVLHIEGDDEDLFATLVAEANEESEDLSSSLGKKKVGKSQEEKEAERLSKEAEKEAKRLAAEVAKKEKEEKAAAEKAEKEAKKEQERLAREAKKVEEEAAKKLKEEQRLKDKAEKEAKLAAEKAAKEAAKSQKSSKKADPKEEKAADEEPDVVKKIEFEGKKYLKSKKTNIVYDYDEYVKNGEQVVVGKWNDTTNKIEFVAAEVEEEEEEEEEEEYDM